MRHSPSTFPMPCVSDRRAGSRGHLPILLSVVALASLAFLIPADSLALAAADGPDQPYPCERDLIEVMFARDSQVRLVGGEPADLSGRDALRGVQSVLSRAGSAQWRRICETPPEVVDELTAQGEAETGRSLYNPNNIYRIRIGPGSDVWRLCRDLEVLPGVHQARPVPLPMALPTPPDYVSSQGYLRPASTVPAGVDADYAWTRTGGDGAGIHICDLEYSWNYLHNDLLGVTELHIFTQDPQNDQEHGTAVLGVLGSHSNGYGTSGICYNSALYTCGTYFRPIQDPNYSWNVAGALVDAASAAVMNPGDVILIEHQWDLTGSNGFVPIEWWGDSYPNQTYNSVYSTIEWVLAVKRMHVVEPAGNGSIDLDGLNWYGDSGAIIVGAGGAYPGGAWTEGNLQRLSFSSYGARVDLQGWGEDVVTTGYGYLYGGEGVNYYYTASFDGTSSASPVVAGAVGSCAGFWNSHVSSRFSMPPRYARRVLKATGTAQIKPPAGDIGPRPDLQAAFARIDDWVDATTAPLNDTGGYGSWGDYDNDGDPDIYVPHSPYITNKLFRNDGGGSFTDVTPDLLKDLYGYGGGAVWGDYDNDGDLDLYLANSGGGYNKLFRNDSGTFVDATSGMLGSPLLGSSPTWLDYDNDGDLDLYVAKYGGANKLLRNDSGTFVDATSGPEGDTGNTNRAAWCDYDGDGDLDTYLTNFNGNNKLLRNDAGTFVDVTPAALAVYDGGNGCWGDYDKDGDFDLYLVIHTYGVANKLFRNDGSGVFTDVTAAPLGDALHCISAAWLDEENDGDLDLYLVNNTEGCSLFRNDGSGGFSEDTHGLLTWEATGGSPSWCDYDLDGDLDAYVGIYFPAGMNTLAQNRTTGNNHWLGVRCVGVSSNRFGIGARVRVTTGRGSQIQEIKSDCLEHNLTAVFGLGSESTVASLEITWPGGAVQESLNVAADQIVVITQQGQSEAPTEGRVAVTRLYPAAPNPRTGSGEVLIRYDLSEPGTVRLSLFDVSGRLVRRLVDLPDQESGRHLAVWDGLDESGHRAAPGVYFCRLDSGSRTQSRRIVIAD